MQKNILIVDDDAHIREVLQFALEKAGFGVEAAVNGKVALEKASARIFDCIVLDITMPEMDGLEVCKMLRKTSEIPILFLSSRDEEIDRIIGFEIGGDDYVTHGFAEAFARKIGEIEYWLNDTDSKIKAFAEKYIHGLKLQIDAENKRADEDIILRKHQYGADADSE